MTQNTKMKKTEIGNIAFCVITFEPIRFRPVKHIKMTV